MIVDKLTIIDDIEIEYKKLYNECKKKYTSTRDAIDLALKALSNIRAMNNTYLMESELKKSIQILMQPIVDTSEKKHAKLFITAMCIVKKLVTYNLISQALTTKIVDVLKGFMSYSSDEFVQIKVLETLLPLIDPKVINTNENFVNNILIMCLKIFTSKSAVLKNPVTAIFKQLMLTLFGFLDSLMRPAIERNLSFSLNPCPQIVLLPAQSTTDQKEEPAIKESNVIKVDQSLSRGMETIIEEESNDIKDSESLCRRDSEKKGDDENIFLQNVNKDQKSEFLVSVLELQKADTPRTAKEANELSPTIPYLKQPVISMVDISEFTDLEIYQTSLSAFKNLILIADGNKKDWIASSTNSKCLGLELLSGIIAQTGTLFKSLPEFLELIQNDVYKIIKKNLTTAKEFIMILKLARITLQICGNLNICYDLLSHFLKLADLMQFTWQKLIGMECVGFICGNCLLLKDLYVRMYSNEESGKIMIYDELLTQLIKVSYSIVSNPAKEEKLEEIRHPKLIEISSILTESDMAVPIVTPSQIYQIVIECFSSIQNSLATLLEKSGARLNEITVHYSPEQLLMKDMVNYNYELIKSALLSLLLNSTNCKITQVILSTYESFVYIYGCIPLPIARDSFLIELCNLISSSGEIDPKNLQLSKTVLSIAKNVKILDVNSWTMLTKAMHQIYMILRNNNSISMLKPSEEYEIEDVIKIVERNIKKHSQCVDIVLLGYYTTLDEVKENETKELSGESTSNTISANLPKKGSGIFSSIKHALGFGAPKEEPTGPKKLTQAEQDDLHFIASTIDSLLLNSNSYDEHIIKDICRALFESSKAYFQDTSSNVISDTATLYLHFNLIKLLELGISNVNRIFVIWDIFSNLTTFLTCKNLPYISRLSIDVVTIMNMFLLAQPYNENYSRHSEWCNGKWQGKMFNPLFRVSKSNISQEVNLNIIYNLSKLLLKSGVLLNSHGWTSYIDLCQSLISKSDEAQCEHTYKLTEMILREYSGYLTVNNISSMLALLENFTLYKNNNILSLSAIELFSICSNITENLLDKDKEIIINDDDVTGNMSVSREEFLQGIWKEIFEKLLSVTTDKRLEIRKSAILAFSEIFSKKIKYISTNVAVFVINNIFLEVLEKSYKVFDEKFQKNCTKKILNTESQKNQPKAPVFTHNIGEFKVGDFIVDQLKLPEKKVKLDEEGIANMSKNIEEKEWEDTVIICIQALSGVIKAFVRFYFIDATSEEKNDVISFRENILSNLIVRYCKIMRFTSPEVACHLFSSLNDICAANSFIFLNNFEYIWKVYEEFGRFITTEIFLTNLFPCATSSKMVFNVLENLKDIFMDESHIKMKPDINTDSNLDNLLLFLQNLIKSCRNSEGVQVASNPQKLLNDERQIFQFAEKFHILIPCRAGWLSYCNFLSSFLKIDITDLHTEAHCRKSLELFNVFFANPNLDHGFAKEYMPKLIFEVKDLSCLRSKPDYVSMLMKNNKSQLQLWHFAISELIKILTSVLSCGSKSNGLTEKDGGKEITICSMKSKTNPYAIWESVISNFEEIFRESEMGYKTIVKNLQEELIKSSQEMEVEIINFIVNFLLPNSLNIPKEMQIKLLILLDMGSNFETNVANSTSQANSSTSSIAKVCISNLFELSKIRSEESLRKEAINFNEEDYVKIKIKIAKMCTPILIKRCKETLKKFLDDEIKSGSMPLSRSRLDDIKYVLEKLKYLEVHPNYNKIDDDMCKNHIKDRNNETMLDMIFKTKKSHLFLLLPLLSEFITTKENEIKLLIKDIFRIISSEMGIK